ncbi:MAG: hypothetical protein ACLTE2_07340, partial [Eubacteriales bacterium]
AKVKRIHSHGNTSTRAEPPYGQQQIRSFCRMTKMNFYLCMVEELESRGYHQYEISNFAQKDANGMLQISKHNTKYWQEE